MEKLKSCPFCGSEKLHIFSKDITFGDIVINHKKLFFVCCINCNAKSADCDIPQNAIKAWNMRA